MQRATDLSKSFADQGLKIRVRKDPRSRCDSARLVSLADRPERAGKMTRRKASDDSDEGGLWSRGETRSLVSRPQDVEPT